MKHKYFLSAFCFFAIYLLPAQKNISVHISDENTKQPIVNANISVKGSDKGFVSNSLGEFIINTSLKDTDTLIISHIKYFTETLSLNKLKKLNYKISLQQSTQYLNKVVLKGRKKLKSKIAYSKLTSIPKSLSNFDAYIHNNSLVIIGGMQLREHDSWKEITEKDQYREVGGPTLGQVINNTLFIPNWKSFNSNVYKFDLNEHTWNTDKKKTIKRAFHNVQLNNDKAYIVGGKRLNVRKKEELLENRIEILDLKDNSIIVDKANPHKAVNFASFIYKNKLILMGGSIKATPEGYKTFTNKVHFQNLDTGAWYDLVNMPVAKETKGVLINDKIYLFGGYNNTALKGIESFNLSTGKWQKEGDLFFPIENAAIAKNDHIVYIFEKGHLITFNTKSKRLNSYQIGLDINASKLICHNEALYIIGGLISTNYSTASSKNIYTIDLKEFGRTKIVSSKIL